jgi:hypothetical protein
MSNHDEQDLLAQALRDKAAGVGGHPIDMASVRGRAQGIRRRRNAVRGAVAAMVAAVAVPSGLTVTTALDSPDDSTPPPVASGSPTAGESARPTGPTELTLAGLEQGEAPAVPYLTVDPASQGDVQLVTPDGVLELDPDLGPVQAVAPFGDGYQVLAYPGPAIFHLDADGQIVSKEQYPAGESMAQAHDGSRVAYTLIDPSDGAQLLTSVPTSGNLEPVNWRLPAKPVVRPVGFVDDDTVVFETTDAQGTTEVYTASVGEEPEPFTELLGAGGAGAGIIAGVTKRNSPEPSVCSGAVSVESGERLWDSCDYSLTGGALSPDGQLLHASPGYTSGYGTPSITLLDAESGDPVADFRQASKDGQAMILQQVWESDDTVLATIADGPDFAVVRLDTQGGIELAVPPVKGEAFGDAPFWFGR